MRIRNFTALAFLSIFLVGCPPPEEEPAVRDDRPVEEDVDVMDRDREFEVGHEETVGLTEIRDSGISGEARFTVTGPTETQVMLEIDDAQPNATLSGRIERGTCDEIERAHTPGERPGAEPGAEPGEPTPDRPEQIPDEDRPQTMVGDELEQLTTDQDGHGISTTVLDMRFEQLQNQAVLVEDEAGQLVACGDIDDWGLTGAW